MKTSPIPTSIYSLYKQPSPLSISPNHPPFFIPPLYKMNKSTNPPKERPQRHKTPSFSSILLDSIYHSLDETKEVEETRTNLYNYNKNNVLMVEQDLKTLRGAIMLDKWMEKHSSSSSSNSTLFSFSEREHSSRTTPKSSSSSKMKHAERSQRTQNGVLESRFTRTKSRVLKIYGDLKKVKQPMSPGTKIANFLNSVFSSRNLKNHHHHQQSSSSEGFSSMRKSRSVKDPTIFSSLTSRSCLSKAPSSRTKSKRCVRFGPVNIIEPHEIGSNFIRENMYNLPSFQDMKSEESEDEDIRSCTSSDLFELDMHREELPVFGTTNMKINQAIANSYLFS